MHIRTLLAVGVLASMPAAASIQWRGDFETGDLSQWGGGVQRVSPDRMQVVPNPVIQGKYAVKVTVHQGDNPLANSSGNRSELMSADSQPEGSEAYYRWSTMFSPDFPSEYTWQVFTQWHQPEDCCGSPPIQFQVMGEEIQLTLSTAETRVWQTPLVRGAWHDFILHAKFSDDPSTGFVELWYDGDHVLPKTYGATRANAYLKQGLYRNSNIAADGIVYHDAMLRGDSLADVMPPPSPAAPSPSPAPSGTPSSIPKIFQGGQGPGSAVNGHSGCSASGGSSSLVALALVGLFWTLRRRPLARARSCRPVNNA